ncbi:hypothetical protein Hmuk_3230 (plasmid) [Halomicrobium mukohataei DSM 12286]|uniref:Uncharacterized protein n=1 Tax=Halomicrobium mukohataei (strain ATCC 700874 / DSM 12286 / JCM 9738 / NCIMB 13541) TaxID=485914 RepID=C7P4T7_HALMD|nr:hypothetical protein Hmuk_3230 [Halomicrobium mukohataei DSM 12286]
MAFSGVVTDVSRPTPSPHARSGTVRLTRVRRIRHTASPSETNRIGRGRLVSSSTATLVPCLTACTPSPRADVSASRSPSVAPTPSPSTCSKPVGLRPKRFRLPRSTATSPRRGRRSTPRRTVREYDDDAHGLSRTDAGHDGELLVVVRPGHATGYFHSLGRRSAVRLPDIVWSILLSLPWLPVVSEMPDERPPTTSKWQFRSSQSPVAVLWFHYPRRHRIVGLL